MLLDSLPSLPAFRRRAAKATRHCGAFLRPAFPALVVVATALLLPGLPLAAQVDPNAPTDEQVAAALAAAERLLDQGRTLDALLVIRPVAQARPDVEQATFSMGLAALAAGDAAVRAGINRKDSDVKGNYDLAIRSFRGMLVKDPNRMRVRLELARALFSRGNCTAPPKNLVKHLLGDDCWASEQHFLRVVGQDVPPQVVMNIRRFIQICRARKRATGSLSLSLAPDTNVNTATSAQTVSIFGLPFQLDEAARQTSGIGVVGVAGAEIQRPLPWLRLFPNSATRLRVGGSIYRRDYSGGDFDDSNYGIYAGPRFISRGGQFSVLFQADSRAVNGRPYSRQYGLRVEGVRVLMPRIYVGGSAEASRQTAMTMEGPLGKPGLSWNGQSFLSYQLFPSLSLRFMGGVGRENTDRVTTRHRSRWGGLMATYDLPLGFSVTAAQQYFTTFFQEPNRLFSPDPPSTQMWFSRLAVFNRLIQIKGFSPSVSVIREDRDSNLTLYEYRRYRVEGGFVRVF